MDIIIVDNDTLRAIGLRQLLLERHGLEALIVPDDPAHVEGISESTLFFVTTDAFAARPYFYVPRRHHVVLITDRRDMPLPVLPPHAPEEEILHLLDADVHKLGAVAPPTSLSPRETDVLRLVAKGMINKEIAAELGLSFNTVLTHRKNLQAKLGLKNSAALTIYAVMNGLVDAHDTPTR